MGSKKEMNRIGVWVVLVLASAAVWAQGPGPLTAEQKQRVDAIVGKMTTEEKIDYIGGTGFAVRAVPRLGLPAFEMSDGPLGVRSNQRFPSTVYAAGIGLAATWNPQLAVQVGEGIGKDARARGIHFIAAEYAAKIDRARHQCRAIGR